MTRFWRKSSKRFENISSVSMQSWNPARRALISAGDIVETRIEDEVAESPGHYLFIRNRLKVVLSRHFCPEIALVSHIDGQRHRHGFGNVHIEHAGDAGPHELPAEVITIGDIEDFVFRRFCLARPSGGTGEDVGRSDLIECPVGCLRTWESQGKPKFLRNGGVDGDYRQ